MGADRLVVGLAGSWPTVQEISWLQKWRPYGVILFSRNVNGPSQLKELCSYLRSLVPHLNIMADHEGGPVSQLAQALGRPPAAWTLGKIDDLDLTRRVHERTARLMVSAGVSWVLAPCADVMTNVHNPVIGVRAFGAKLDVVSPHVRAAVQGLLSGGIQVCLKHWPGHGSTGQDSHLERAIMSQDCLAEAAIPFHGGLEAGANAVMVGHLCLGNSSTLPATLDASFLAATRLALKGDNDSGPLLVADDITMGGLREPMAALGICVAGDSGNGLLDPADLPLSWFETLVAAGCDLLLIRGLPLLAYPVQGVEIEGQPPVFDQVNIGDCRVNEYVEARTRATVGDDFFHLDKAVLWIDLTEGDRWAVASGSGYGQERSLDEILSESFGEVCKGFAGRGAAGTEYSFSRVVLVSHRPLSWDYRQPPAWLANLANSGQAVVMGHPSLATDFFAALPVNLKDNWLITPVYDITGGDLRPLA